MARESLLCQSRVARQSLSNFACKLNSKVWFRRRASAVFLSKFISEFSPARQKHDVISSGGELTDMPETEPNHSVVLFTDNPWEKSAILYTHFEERYFQWAVLTSYTPCRLPDLNIRELKHLLPSSFHRRFQSNAKTIFAVSQHRWNTILQTNAKSRQIRERKTLAAVGGLVVP